MLHRIPAGAALLSIGLSTTCLLTSCSDDPVPTPCAGADCGAGGQGGAGGEGPGLVCPESGVLHGPWSMRVTPTGAAVRWDACKPSPASILVTPEAGGAAISFEGTQTAAEVTTDFSVLAGVPADYPGTYFLTEAVASGLAPGTCYRYEVAAEPGRAGRLCTARPSGAPFTFMAIGDTNPALGSTAATLSRALARSPDFVVHVGDIQYYSSVFESWSAWFPAMAPMLRQGAFFPAIGNHESEIEGEFVDYYSRLFGGAGEGGKVEYYRFQSGGVWFFSLDTELDVGQGSEQAAWLEQQLADASAQPGYRFSIVYFHRPFITLSEYSQDKAAREYFKPIFLQRRVRLVLQGHVHGYERFEDGELTYLTTGGGGAALHDVDVNVQDRPEEAALRAAAASVHHSIVFDVTATELRGEAIDERGAIVDSFVHPAP